MPQRLAPSAVARSARSIAQLRRRLTAVAGRWTWEPAKAVVNRAKHGLKFETAVLVFGDAFHASKPDPHPDGDRWHHRTCWVSVATCDSHLAGRTRRRR